MPRALGNERGIALLTVLAVLAMLLVLSSLVAGSARVESTLSGVSRQGERAFAAADAGLGLALGDANNFVQLLASTNTPCGFCGLCTADLHAVGLPVTGNVCATFRYEAPPPIEIHVSALRFKGFYFEVEGTGTAATNASSTLDMMATRLGPAQ